jgi:hypothetical protein
MFAAAQSVFCEILMDFCHLLTNLTNSFKPNFIIKVIIKLLRDFGGFLSTFDQLHQYAQTYLHRLDDH